MRRPTAPLAGLALFAFALPFFAGCGGGTGAADGRVIVKGKLLKGGSPYVVDQSKIKLPKGATSLPPGSSASSMLQVTFIATDSKEQHTASTNADSGTFEVAGSDGKGIKPGRYKVAVNVRAGFGPGEPDLFDNKFSAEKTQIVREVKAGEDVVIDLDKP